MFYLYAGSCDIILPVYLMPVITSFFFPTTFKLGLKERKKESKGDENDKDVMENGLHKTSEKQNA